MSTNFTDDDTVFLRASWLLEQELGCVLPSRRHLPPQAFVTCAELLQSYERRNLLLDVFPLIAVSHCWRTKEHPDPEGATTLWLQTELNRRELDRYDFEEVGLFIDWCSLWQWPRTPAQQASFDRALRNLNTWYAHQLTMVWCITDAQVRHGDRTLGYNDKGWTTFERELALMAKRSKLQIKGLKSRKPPAEPLAFFANHRYGDKIYTNGADRDKIVAPKFQKAAQDVLSSVTDLNYFGEPWDDASAARFGLIAPLCVSLRSLDLRYVGLTAVGLKAAILEPALREGAYKRLEELDLRGNPLHDISLLSYALDHSFFSLRTIYLQDCNLKAKLHQRRELQIFQ